MRFISIGLTIVLLILGGCASPPVTQKEEKRPVAKVRPTVPGVIRQLSEDAPPERNRVRNPYRYDRTITMGRIPGVRLYTYEPDGREEVVGFALTDRGSERINKRGLAGKGAKREFLFQFPDRAREEIGLLVSDDVALSRRYSHDNMFRELYFFPRRQLPSLERKANRFKVRLPTGEPVEFDARTAEVVGGVLQEQPIDFNRNRHARHNPRIGYSGKGLMITVAQRGEAPRRAKVWGTTKRAEVRFPARYAKACYISPALLWDQRPKKGDTDPRLTWRMKSDDAVFKLVEKRCGWDLQALRGDSSKQALRE
jgi:hypothetical protein